MLNILKQFSEQLISPDLFIRKRYATFQQLLEYDRKCHTLLAELEDIYYSAAAVDINRVRNIYPIFPPLFLECWKAWQILLPDSIKT